jgi:16S rRNA (cytosine967-C5)-methyltransferase
MAHQGLTQRQPPGFASRRLAADILEAVLRRKQPLDDALEAAAAGFSGLSERDRAFTRMLVATALRRLGSLRALLAACLDRGLPGDAPRVEGALLLGAAQILWLDVPDHAAVDLSVRLVQDDRRAARYAGLANAVLRRIARESKAWLATVDLVALDTPAWLLTRWTKNFGAEIARAIAAANAQEPPLDLTVKSDPDGWAKRLAGQALITGSVRTLAHGPVTALSGFSDGEWWVQDAAAALPARLLGDVRGLRVADLCAAPGGKTAQLAQAGAHVTAVDRSPTRLARLRENLARLRLQAETVAADVAEWSAEPFDAVLRSAIWNRSSRCKRACSTAPPV